ncbi:MAG: hypothetical protein O2820_25430 [Planctomycetota bacterium]|nr:hypothetical protein [Planctomycetota bacterium]
MRIAAEHAAIWLTRAAESTHSVASDVVARSFSGIFSDSSQLAFGSLRLNLTNWDNRYNVTGCRLD